MLTKQELIKAIEGSPDEIVQEVSEFLEKIRDKQPEYLEKPKPNYDFSDLVGKLD